jgi:hypothetical protein
MSKCYLLCFRSLEEGPRFETSGKRSKRSHFPESGFYREFELCIASVDGKAMISTGIDGPRWLKKEWLLIQ